MAAIIGLAPAMASQAQVATWVSDPVGTWMEVSFKHSNLYEVTVTAPNMIATVAFNGDDLTAAHFEISAAADSMWSHNNLFDGAMMSELFFNVKQHPSVYFSSKRIMRDVDTYRVLGDLTANGVTRPTEFRMTASKIVPWEGTAFRAFTLTATIDGKDFGMTFKNPDGLKNDPLFGDKLNVKFTVEVTDKPNASKFTPPPTRDPFTG